jgi:hypothetical protein
METITRKLEFELSPGVWTNITADNLPEYPISWNDGICSLAPLELLAGGGMLEFTLDNGATNSAGLAGYYTPGHANCRVGFAKGIRVRFSLIYGGTIYYQNIYWLEKPMPSPGTWGERITSCKAIDWLELMTHTPLPTLAIATNKRMDELVLLILAALATAPAATSYETCQQILPSAFDADRSERDTVYSVLAKLCRSEFGRIYMQSGATAGLLRVEDSHFRLANTTSQGTLDEIMDELELPEGDELNYSQVQVTVTPRRVDEIGVVIASLKSSANIALAPGEERTFALQYTNPAGGGRISARDIVTPIAGTDYKFGSKQDDVTQDMNDYLDVSLDAGGNDASITIGNTSPKGQYGYLNLFQLRGLGIYSYDQFIASAGEGLPVLTFDMPYQSDPLIADSVANYIYSLISAGKYGRVVRFHANKSTALMEAALTGGISTRWTILEAQTATGAEWFINGRNLTLSAGNRLDVEWYCVPAENVLSWILGESELEIGTMLVPSCQAK